MANEHNIIWVDQPGAPKGWPVFREQTFRGTFTEAMDYVASLAKGAGFIVGQILSPDGKILATVAP